MKAERGAFDAAQQDRKCELSVYNAGPLRGSTPRIDAFAGEGMRLLNFAPETQCTPTRSALMTGRYSIRSGNQTVALAGSRGGLVKWERTMGDIFSEAGYATAVVGKWHVGDSAGRWPTDHGFDEWYGIPRSYDECLWPDDPWYDPKRDLVTHVLEGRKGEPVRELEQLTLEIRRDIDVEYMKRAKAFLKRATDERRPFFLYFNHSMMHLPTIPRSEFKGKTGRGDFVDSLLELDDDFGTLLDYLQELGVEDNTLVVFAGDNGPEEMEPWRGSGGPWEGFLLHRHGGFTANARTRSLPGSCAGWGSERRDRSYHGYVHNDPLLGRFGNSKRPRYRWRGSKSLFRRGTEKVKPRWLSLLDGLHALWCEVA
jgi:arylsulfatase A-like enzyme